MKIYVKNEISQHTYIKSFFQRGVHYVVLVRTHDEARRILNLKNLEYSSQHMILTPLLSKSLRDYA